ncbi:MAG: hypothetical protein K2K83_06655 [Rikenella sp.]|nr:hypothetical protein [Rikenella sp.]
MWSVGNRGFCWTSAFTGTSARFLYFYSGGISPNNDSCHRADGFQLRCLQE